MFFYHLNSNVTLGEVIDTCNLKNSILDRSISLKSFLKPSISSFDDLTFYINRKYPPKTNSEIIITTAKLEKNIIGEKKLLISNNIDFDIASLSHLFYRSKNRIEISKLNELNISDKSGIAKNSSVERGVCVGDNFILGEYSSISHSCIIGNNVTIGKNVSISDSIIGDNVFIADGTKIGQPGFGFAYNGNTIKKIFHIGRVIIQNDVNIGANCTIDRGSFSDTVIGEKTYIDNLVHIAHNVSIGNNCIIAGQCGFAGSAEIGNYVHIGGQTGIAGHIKINDGAKIAAKSGVIRDIATNETVMGYPAINVNKYLKNYKKNMIDTWKMKFH